MSTYIFKTRWGWFGLAGSAEGLQCACLPMADKQAVLGYLQAEDAGGTLPEKTLSTCQGLICDYFEGKQVDFSRMPIDWGGFTPFQRDVLRALQMISYGKTISYADLAELAGRPRAVRAAANTVAKNLLPLIIPCHRVVRKDGSLGGFSAPGGITIKEKLLTLEHIDLSSGRVDSPAVHYP